MPKEPADAFYRLVFAEVERQWEDYCTGLHPRAWQYVLVGEWSAASGPLCSGTLLRAWVRDAGGLREIAPAEYREHRRKIRTRI